MTRRKWSPLASIALVVLGGLVLSGCTVIGFATGRHIDRGDASRYRPAGLAGLQPGAHLRVWLDDGRELRGRLIRSEPDLVIESADSDGTSFVGGRTCRDTVSTARVERVAVPRESYRFWGLGIGAVVDLTLAYVMTREVLEEGLFESDDF